VNDVPPQPLPPPPGWYPDPGGSCGQRWWDGHQWTEHVHAASAAPAAPAPARSFKPRYEQKWWHLPLVIGLAVTWTIVWVVLQFVT
jgi:uncharacterized protein DUF2510